MSPWVYGAVLGVCGLTAGVLIVDLVRDRAAQDAHFVGLAVVEVAALVQLVWGCVALAQTERDVQGATFVSYLVTVALAPVVGALFSLMERSRAGTAVLLLAVATVAGLEVRLWDIWTAGG